MSDYEQLSLLPMPPFAPTWPKPNTLPGKALRRMLTGERLTQPRFGLNCWRLSAYVGRLQDLGWPVERMDVPAPAGCGAGHPIREYWLAPRIIEAAREARP